MRRVYGIFLVAFREASWNFPRQDHDSKEFRGFPGMELGIFRAAKSSGEGRRIVMRLALLESHELLSTSQRGHNTRRACRHPARHWTRETQNIWNQNPPRVSPAYSLAAFYLTSPGKCQAPQAHPARVAGAAS